ncbi:MAG TPA: glycerate kinase [Mycobacteriales bacterium]|nr:glycerate kinase [Mycobacteriales bacterium]
MRVVVAPDKFGGTLTAAQAAKALAAGWHDVAPADELVLVPLSDGGPGLIAALATALPGSRIHEVEASGPTGVVRRRGVLLARETAYVESAIACGLDELRAERGDVGTASTYGVGQLIAAAIEAGDEVRTVVVGLGGSGTNDGGAGMWAALGAEPRDRLVGGGAGLRDLDGLVAPAGLGVRLVAATDVDNPLLGLHGATAVYGPQKGADQAAIMSLDAALERWADAVEPAVGRPGLRTHPGAGAAGGLGFGLLALGAERESGADLVMAAVGLADAIEGAELVVTGEGSFDATSLRGKVASGVAERAQAAGVPCVVAAGQAHVGSRDASAHGFDEVWSVADQLGSAEAALAAGAAGVRALGAALARSWSR